MPPSPKTRWNIGGDENGVFDFPDEAARDAKIADMVSKGCEFIGPANDQVVATAPPMPES
jgi:hypothetical protein